MVPLDGLRVAAEIERLAEQYAECPDSFSGLALHYLEQAVAAHRIGWVHLAASMLDLRWEAQHAPENFCPNVLQEFAPTLQHPFSIQLSTSPSNPV